MKYLLLLLALFIPLSSYAVTTEDLKCLTDNIYYESRGEPIIGQALVGYSVINRMKDERWKNTICGVVYERKQYSWTLSPSHQITDLKAYTEIQDLAFTLLDNVEHKEATGVNHYLRCDVRWKIKNRWWQSMEFLGAVGNHCFYKG